MSFKDEYIKTIPGTHLIDEPLARHTTFRIGGPADVLSMPRDGDAIVAALKFLANEKIPHFILGGGSNLLVSDGGFRGVVIKAPRKGSAGDSINIDGCDVSAPTGATLMNLVVACAEAGLGGLENLAGIPGTVGGAIYMNAGAFGSCVSDSLISVEIASAGYGIHALTRDEMSFGYRTSGVQNRDDIAILSATFRLSDTSTAQALRLRISEIISERKKKQPPWLPCAGSFFKNPINGEPAGKLIELSGLKGARVGGAMVSVVHANFIVNIGGATCSQVLELMEIVRAKVKDSFGVILEPEVRIV